MTDNEILELALKAEFSEQQWDAMTYEYDLTGPTIELRRFAEFVAAAASRPKQGGES